MRLFVGVLEIVELSNDPGTRVNVKAQVPMSIGMQPVTLELAVSPNVLCHLRIGDTIELNAEVTDRFSDPPRGAA